ncbi:MAG TPA: hypothetical protein ENK26_05450 [Gammaproteobacteria bacterium]|nr:hypothetical protein [Gammaproteobacteria bacterium]
MASQGAIPSTTPNPALVSALRRLLRPLIRLLISHQITFPWLSSFIKSIYVEVAVSDFKIDGKLPNHSRVTLLTGVHRKDVRRFREELSENSTVVPRSVHIGSQLVAKWCGDLDYVNDSGHPRALPRLKRKDGGPSFEGLVASVSKDFRARAVLDEWLRLGIVELVDKDCVQLRTEAFVPREGFEEKVYYLGKNLESHMEACVNNIENDTSPMMERSVYYDQLSQEDIRELEELARHGAMETLHKVNRLALKLRKKTERKDIAKTGIMNYGFYFYHKFPVRRADADQDGDKGSSDNAQRTEA